MLLICALVYVDRVGDKIFKNGYLIKDLRPVSVFNHQPYLFSDYLHQEVIVGPVRWGYVLQKEPH